MHNIFLRNEPEKKPDVAKTHTYELILILFLKKIASLTKY